MDTLKAILGIKFDDGLWFKKEKAHLKCNEERALAHIALSPTWSQ